MFYVFFGLFFCVLFVYGLVWLQGLLFGFCKLLWFFVFFFKQKTAYEVRISDWSSDVCSSDLLLWRTLRRGHGPADARSGLRLSRLDDHLGSLRLLHLHPLRDRGGDPVGGAPAVLRHPPADRPYHQRARSGADCGLWLSGSADRTSVV